MRKENSLLSAFQVPNPFGFALKSPNLGPFGMGGCAAATGGGETIETGDGGYPPRTGELLGPSLSDHDGAR